MICFIENKKKQTSKWITKDFRTNKLSEQNKGSNERELCQNFINFFSISNVSISHVIRQTIRTIFNCLFCFCPLYLKGAECGGNFRYTEKGVKDCSQCMFPALNGKIILRWWKNCGRSKGENLRKVPGRDCWSIYIFK